jgi:ABC-type branched-subunit amino acid transport system ATPase component
MLKLRDVSKKFNNLMVLKKINLDIRTGETIGIYGPNGSGKSTLLKILSGFTKPSCGKVFINDRDITEMPAEKRAELGIAYAFQIPRPFERLTVFENIYTTSLLRSDPEEAAIKTEELLYQFELSDVSDSRAANLSQGEMKLLEICRSVATQPDFLLLDEPFAALDKENARVIRRKIRMLRSMDMGIVITAHRSRILEGLVDRIMKIEYGILNRE